MQSKQHVRMFLTVITAIISAADYTSCLAEPLRILSPNGMEDIEGNDWGTLAAIGQQYHVQILHPDVDFSSLSGLPSSHRWLTGILLRSDGQVTSPSTATQDMILRVGLSDRTTLSTQFSANLNSSLSEVFRGTWKPSTSAAEPPGDGPHDFDIPLWFDGPFLYDPTKGSLLIDLLVLRGGGEHFIFDGQTTPAINTVIDWNGISSSYATNAYDWTWVAQFIFAEPGDFNGDLAINEADMNSLMMEMQSGHHGERFDLNDDRRVDSIDQGVWIHDLMHTWYGDANLDGEFNTGDFVQVFEAGKYEAGKRVGWAEGDWDGNGFFDTGDLVLALQDGGYELGPRSGAAVVPEPKMWHAILAGSYVFMLWIQRIRSSVLHPC